jgi:hypothetical protein
VGKNGQEEKAKDLSVSIADKGKRLLAYSWPTFDFKVKKFAGGTGSEPQ